MLEIPEPAYTGMEYSAADVESLRQEHQSRQTEALERFRGLERQYDGLSEEIARDAGAGTDWSERMQQATRPPTVGERFRGALARVGLAKRPKSLSRELEERLESVQVKIHAVARLRESLDADAAALEDDVRRLNHEVVQAAHNEETAASHVLELSRTLEDREARLLAWDVNDRTSAAYREAVAEVDELRAQIRIHGSKARAFGHAEDRLASIVEMNRTFLEMLRNAGANMEQLAGAAHQVVDEIGGNVQALMRLSLANEMATDLIQASRELQQSVNRVAVVASQTSLELTRDIDRFVGDLQVYDEETVAAVQRNVTEERRLRQEQVDAAIARAWEATASGEGA